MPLHVEPVAWAPERKDTLSPFLEPNLADRVHAIWREASHGGTPEQNGNSTVTIPRKTAKRQEQSSRFPLCVYPFASQHNPPSVLSASFVLLKNLKKKLVIYFRIR